MTELKPYPKYKDSGVEWIGEIPESWEVSRLKASIKYVKNGIWGTDEKRDLNDIYCVRIADFDRNKARVKNIELTIRNIPKNDQKHYILKSGDLLIEKSGGGDKQPVGYTVLYDLDKKAVYSNFIAKMRLYKNKVNPYFMTYLHQSIYAHKINVKSIKQTTGIQNLDLESYFNEKVAYPPLHEQEKIVSYLNRKSFYIDSLIVEKKRLIALLEEKRQAVITETVTKGLNPNVKMKNSGIEWIGEIPEHWSMSRFKRYMNVKNGKEILDENNSDKDKKYNVYGSGGAFKQTKHYLHEGKSVLFGRKGTIGKPIFVDEKFWTVDTMYYTEFKNTALAEYFYFILTIFPWETISTNTAIPSVVGTDVENSYIAVPPLEEQKKIIKILNDKTRELDSIVELISNQISKLQEYRESLIYEAVTGKIDLREYSLEKEQTDWNDMGKVAELNETYQ